MTDDLYIGRTLHAVYCEVGRITLAWAQIDMLLDYCSVILRDRFGAHPNWKDIPRTRLNEKIRHLRDYSNDIVALARFKGESQAIADALSSLSNERHWVVHAASHVADVGNDGIFRMTRARLKGTPSMEERQISLSELESITKQSLELAMRLNRFLLFSLLGLTQDEFDKLAREYTVRGA
jgi:hypothetical protein